MILSSDSDKVGFVDDGNLEEWPKSLIKLEKRFNNIRVVIPGHRNPDNSMIVTHTKSILNKSTTE